MVVENEEEPLDLTTIPALFSTNRSVTDIVPPAPTRVQFGRDTTHTYTTSNPPGLPSSPGATAPSQAGATSSGANSGNDSNSDNNSGASSDGGDAGNNDDAAGGTRDGDDHQNAGDDVNLIEKIIFSCKMVGGPVSGWGLAGRFQARPLIYIANQLVISRGRLIRSMFMDEVTALVQQAFAHNNRVRVRSILDSMDVYMLRGPGQSTEHLANLAVLLDDTQTTQGVCERLLGFVNHARTLSNDELPLEVPLVFFSGRIHQHPHGMIGSFEYLREVADDGTDRVRVPYGQESNRTPIVEPTSIPRSLRLFHLHSRVHQIRLLLATLPMLLHSLIQPH